MMPSLFLQTYRIGYLYKSQHQYVNWFVPINILDFIYIVKKRTVERLFTYKRLF